LARFRATVLCGCLALAVPTLAQAQEDPENEKGLGLWLDQGLSAALSPNRSLEFEFHERFDDGASNLYEYFVQGGMSFRLRQGLTLTPIYRYQRYPDADVSHESRLILNVTLVAREGRWRPTFRFLTEGRFPEGRDASARFRFRLGIDYTLPLRTTRPPVLVVNNEFFIVPGTNSFAAGGAFTQNRFQAGVRLPVSDTVAVRPYFMLQSLNLTTGWDTNSVVGVSLALRF
jgi:hypothetical protein